MIIPNFWRLRNVSVDGLERVNILVGDNGGGKTSLWEALFLALSNATNIAMVVCSIRDLPSILGPGSQKAQDVFADVIAEGNESVGIETKGGRPFAGRLAIKREWGRATVVPLAGGAPLEGMKFTSSTNFAPVPLLFGGREAQGHTAETVAQFGPASITFGTANEPFVGASFAAPNAMGQDG